MSAGVERLVPSVEDARRRVSLYAAEMDRLPFVCDCWPCAYFSKHMEAASVALDMANAAESDRRRGRAA